MADTKCPKCGHDVMKKEELIVQGRLLGGRPFGIHDPRSRTFEAHICAKCGYVADLYYRGKEL